MKREIKFRGRTAKGEWLYGDLVRNQDGRVAIVPPLKGSNNDHSKWEVIPDTVGQHTGFKDKNGTEVYEGDILRAEGYLDLVVDFEDAGFILRPVPRPNLPLGFGAVRVTSCYEVVGNIHDQQEEQQ